MTTNNLIWPGGFRFFWSSWPAGFKNYLQRWKINDKDPKYEVGDHIRMPKYKNIFAKGYTPNWSGEVFVIKKVKNTVSWTCVLEGLNREKKFLEHFMKNSCKRQIKWSLKLKK